MGMSEDIPLLDMYLDCLQWLSESIVSLATDMILTMWTEVECWYWNSGDGTGALVLVYGGMNAAKYKDILENVVLPTV